MSDVTGQVKVKMFDISGLVTFGEQYCDVNPRPAGVWIVTRPAGGPSKVRNDVKSACF